MMDKIKTDVIIPVYRPGKEFPQLLERLAGQSFPVHKIIIMNTEKEFWDPSWEQKYPLLEVHHLTREEFDHGGTRRRAAALSKADIMVFMTQDAVPADRQLIAHLIRPIQEGKAQAAYARQLPREDCSFVEKYTRKFNYPPESSIKTKADIPVYGIKTYFCSNVCAAYSRKTYEELGGFVEKAIFNEDMIYAGGLVQHGGAIAYVSDAKVIHSHNYTARQQFHRNFDLGVSQAEHPEIFEGVPSEGEGLRLVKKTLGYLLGTGRIWLIPGLILKSGCKYAGYAAGKRYQKLPDQWVRRFTMNPAYWENACH
jgi:rhamnosyltransferase